MSIRFTCPCGQRLKTFEGSEGRRTKCSKCLAVLRVPEDAKSTYNTVAEFYPVEYHDPRIAKPPRFSALSMVLIGVMLVFLAGVMMLRASYKPQPKPEEARTLKTREVADTADVQEFAQRYLDKKVARTLPDILQSANKDGMSSDTAYNLIFGAIKAGLVQIDQQTPGKPESFRLK